MCVYFHAVAKECNNTQVVVKFEINGHAYMKRVNTKMFLDSLPRTNPVVFRKTLLVHVGQLLRQQRRRPTRDFPL